ncbi:GMC family oxidoreductase N-terminal domain-containing protein [Streptomyces sp. NPDC048282]|uniref:GMC family oxidoreductase N-terminal domain-containing protein n=1 Tax=Streptomyces sp. NPDC048282 TaxID=3365528 RepID=UPI00371B52FD
MHAGEREFDYDVLVVGSGFGGSVTALRLTEKGYRVGVLEAGRRYRDQDFARTSWRVRKFLWAPALRCFGIMRVTVLSRTLVLSGAGVGGGSLVYGNTLYRPPEAFFRTGEWARITDWRDELAHHYAQAERMLGVTPNPAEAPADRLLRGAAERLGVGATFRPTPVGVHFGTPEEAPGQEVPDPYFGGAGPARRGCLRCGECLTGCRHNAKNTLVKNYLHLAEQAGAEVRPLCTVTAVRPLPGGGYAVDTRATGRLPGHGRRSFTAEQVVCAAAALGTQRLLHTMRVTGRLPSLSPQLGRLARTNSEALLAVRSRHADADFTPGVAITSSVRLDPDTHAEVAHYGRGSNLMSLLFTVLTDPLPGRPRWLRWLAALVAHPRTALLAHSPRRWSERTLGVLVMQSTDNSLTTSVRRGLFGRRLVSRTGTGVPNPTWLPVAHRLTRQLAADADGIPLGGYGELVDTPMTGHFLGGCAIGESARTGVIDAYHRVFGHPGLHVIDGSAVSANLGVNPALTIAALAERATALWPNRGETDPRPPLGAPYRRLPLVSPVRPAVPATAPAALLPVPAVPARPRERR